MKVIITGATGFVGANLAARLAERGDDVYVLVRRESKLWRLAAINEKITRHEADLSDAPALERVFTAVKPEIVYHLGVYGAYSSQTDADLILKTAIFGTLNLIRASEIAGVRVFVNTGSSSEYGTKDHPMSEAEILEPNSYYAVAKAAQTLLCQHVARTSPLAVITLRLFSVYGPFEEPGRLVPNVIKLALAHENIPLAAPTVARDFVYIDDVVDAYIMAAGRPDLSGEVFNIGSGVQTTIRDITDKILEATSSASEPIWGAYGGRTFDTNMWVANMSHTAKKLGFTARTSLAHGIALSVAWFKEHKKFYN